MSPYMLTTSSSSFCPHCQRRVKLLATESVSPPAFFVCFPCQFIGQIGRGVVHSIADDVEQSLADIPAHGSSA